MKFRFSRRINLLAMQWIPHSNKMFPRTHPLQLSCKLSSHWDPHQSSQRNTISRRELRLHPTPKLGCPGYYNKLHLKLRLWPRYMRSVEYPFIAITPTSTMKRFDLCVKYIFLKTIHIRWENLMLRNIFFFCLKNCYL